MATKPGTAAIKYDPFMLCKCGTAVHKGEAQRLHANKWHSENAPAVWREVTRAEHAAAGWGDEGFPAYITC
ncbi:hypothetical protein GCM10018773_58850 [Streptomyces candidus]|nr:hypothetical protein [Streptomyces candidus]GHH55002.1 hypothetical protein GCM10018773_58850 [Streptomyces candidus]